MIDLLLRHRILALFSLVAVVAMVGGFVWWGTSEDAPISAQEMMEDVCASVTYPESFDITVRASAKRGSESGSGELLITYRGNAQAEHYTTYKGDGSPLQEGIFIFTNRLGESTDGISGASDGTASQNVVVITGYGREFSDSGEWGDWDVITTERPAYGAAASSAASGQSGEEEELSLFCGLALEAEGFNVEFRYVGEETINGVRTDHYYHSYSQAGDDSGSYISKEFWLDSDGLFRQVREVAYNAPIGGESAERVESLKTYSGWGEPNVITAPVLPTPTPTVTPEPTPTATSIATPEATVAATPGFTTEDAPASAKAAIEDACEDVALVSHSYDVTDRVTVTVGNETIFSARGQARYNGGDESWTVTDSSGNILAEYVKIATQSDGISHSQGASGTSSTDIKTVSAYTRFANDNGELGEWNVTTQELSPGDTSNSVSNVAGSSGSDPATFCGLPLTSDVTEIEFGYAGEETINGVSTKHYYHSHSPIGDPEEYYIRMDFWFDSSNGRFVQVKHTISSSEESAPQTMREQLVSYSGWGEPNVITAPVLPTPTPTVTPEPTPTATSIATPEATVAATPEPAPTPEPLRVSISVGDTQLRVGERVTLRAVVSSALSGEVGYQWQVQDDGGQWLSGRRTKSETSFGLPRPAVRTVRVVVTQDGHSAASAPVTLTWTDG